MPLLVVNGPITNRNQDLNKIISQILVFRNQINLREGKYFKMKTFQVILMRSTVLAREKFYMKYIIG